MTVDPEPFHARYLCVGSPGALLLALRSRRDRGDPTATTAAIDKTLLQRDATPVLLRQTTGKKRGAPVHGRKMAQPAPRAMPLIGCPRLPWRQPPSAAVFAQNATPYAGSEWLGSGKPGAGSGADFVLMRAGLRSPVYVPTSYGTSFSRRFAVDHRRLEEGNGHKMFGNLLGNGDGCC
jgi:hypothetical protein